MKKIVHIINDLDLGGAETALFRLLRTSYLNYQLYVIVLNEKGHYSTKIAKLGIPIYYLSIRKYPIKACIKLITYLNQIKPNIVQTWLYHSDLIGGLAAKLCGVEKIIWGIRCEGIGLKKSTELIKYFCSKLSKKIPNYIITNSKSAAYEHIKSGYLDKKIKIIYNGFDPEEFYPQKREQQRCINTRLLPSNAIVVGTLARFHEDKDYFNLIQAIKLIIEPNVYFVLCGEGCNSKNNKLATMLKTLKHSDNVILIDGLNEPVSYLNNLDIFVQSSKTESFSNSLAEAMLCALPCIATNVGETRNICGEYALLVPSQDPQKLASSCLDIINKTAKERKDLGILARKHIIEHYSIQAYQNKMQDIYEQ